VIAVMARQSHHREDLLRDATALVPRILLQLTIQREPCEVFAGFRQPESLALYFDDDPVYQFNSQGELRRAFVAGSIIKADGGGLVAWERSETLDQTAMLSRRLSLAETQEFSKSLLARLADLKTAITCNEFTIVGQVPPDGDAFDKLQTWLGRIGSVMIAQSAGAS
jgi:hypothetical protein